MSSTASSPPTAAGERPTFILTLSCEDRPGVVYAVSSFLVQHHCTIISSQQYGDQETGLFFMRVRFSCFDGDELATLQADFGRISATFDMSFTLRGSLERQRVLLMVSKFGHCLNDLLFRMRIGALPIDVVGVVSNHSTTRISPRTTTSPFTTSRSRPRPRWTPRSSC